MSPQVTYLDVPFSEKEQAKNLGAWWDPAAKKWFVPQGKSLEPFNRWIPSEEDLEEDEAE